MKVIIFREGENQVWLHMKDIKKIWSHKFQTFERTEIYFRIDDEKPKLKIFDYHKTDVSRLLYEFMESQEKIKIIKVKTLERSSSFDHHYITLSDWVSQAMGS